MVMAVMPSIIVLAVFTSPLTILTWNGLSTVGLTEESTGYRYFYSLRVLYTADERPWVPQGQVMTLVHMALQLLITAAGYPIIQLTPRMEIFAVIGACAAHLGSAIAAYWGLAPISKLWGRLAAVAVLTMAAFDSSLSRGYYFLVPDYHPWIFAVAFVSLGCTLRLAQVPWSGRSVPRWTLGLGLLAGVVVSLKVTLIVFAVPSVLLLLAQTKGRQSTLAAYVVIGAVIGVLTGGLFVLTTWLSYRGDVGATMRYFTLLAAFGSDIRAEPGPGFVAWYLSRLTQPQATWVVYVTLSAPLIMAASLPFAGPRLVTAACLPAFVISQMLLWKRDEPSTFVEVFLYAYLALVTWVIAVVAPEVTRAVQRAAISTQRANFATWHVRAGQLVLCALCLVVTVYAALPPVRSLLPSFREATEAQRELDALTDLGPGRVAILTLANAARPLTRDSAIYKGGTNIGETGLWGASPFVASLVPYRHYFVPSAGLETPINLASFTYVLFVSREPRGQLAATKAELAEVFGVPLLGFTCPVQAPVSGSIQVGCARRPDVRLEDDPGEIAFSHSSVALEAGGAVRWSSGPARPLRPGELSYVATTGEVWRNEADGEFVRMVGDAMQSAFVASMGAWNARARHPDGAWIRFEQPSWTPTVTLPRPINRNPSLRTQPDGSVRAWEPLSTENVSVERSRAGDPAQQVDGWLELRARAPGARVGVRTSFDRDELRDGPATAYVTVRAFSVGRVGARIGTAAPNAVTSVRQRLGDEEQSSLASGDWQRLVVRVEQEQLDGDRVALVIELKDARADDRLDVGSVEVYAGRLP
jgi:hypothetical protein